MTQVFVRSEANSQYTLVDVLKTTLGKSVFAKYFIKRGTVIECDIELSTDEKLRLLPLEQLIAGVDSVYCIGFGFYLRKAEKVEKANVKIYKIDAEKMKIYFEIITAIKPGEELFLHS